MSQEAGSATEWIGGVQPSAEVRAMNIVQIYEKECREQAARLSELVSAYAENGAIRGELQRLQKVANAKEPIVIAGMGASFCSGVTAASLLQLQERNAFVVDAGG